MTMLVRRIAFLGALGASAACGDRTVADDERVPLTPPDMGVPAESEGGSDGEVVCREGLTACGGTCIDLASNDEHCGACNHACREPFWAGHCLEGACPSAYWCGAAGQGLETCEDVCALHGQECDEGPRELSRGCGGGYDLYFDGNAADCERGLGGQQFIDASCTTPIDWSVEGGFESTPAQAVACCCTQDLPP